MSLGIGIVKGFVPTKLGSIELTSQDCKKYGIKADDFEKADINGDGIITSDEFLSRGINTVSIFNAFKTMAAPMGAFVDANDSTDLNQEIAQNSETGKKQNYNVTHPNDSSPFRANTYDYLA